MTFIEAIGHMLNGKECKFGKIHYYIEFNKLMYYYPGLGKRDSVSCFVTSIELNSDGWELV